MPSEDRDKAPGPLSVPPIESVEAGLAPLDLLYALSLGAIMAGGRQQPTLRSVEKLIGQDQDVLRPGMPEELRIQLRLGREIGSRLLRGEQLEEIARAEGVLVSEAQTALDGLIVRLRLEPATPETLSRVAATAAKVTSATTRLTSARPRAADSRRERRYEPEKYNDMRLMSIPSHWAKKPGFRRKTAQIRVVSDDTLVLDSNRGGALTPEPGAFPDDEDGFILRAGDLKILNMFMRHRRGTTFTSKEVAAYLGEPYLLDYNLTPGLDIVNLQILDGLRRSGLVIRKKDRPHNLRLWTERQKQHSIGWIGTRSSKWTLNPGIEFSDERSGSDAMTVDAEDDSVRDREQAMVEARDELSERGLVYRDYTGFGSRTALLEELGALFNSGELQHVEGDKPDDRQRIRDKLHMAYTRQGRLICGKDELPFADGVIFEEAVSNGSKSGKHSNIDKRPQEYPRFFAKMYPHLMGFITTSALLTPAHMRELEAEVDANLFRTFTEPVQTIHTDNIDFGFSILSRVIGGGVRTRFYIPRPDGKYEAIHDTDRRPVYSREIRRGHMLGFHDPSYNHDATTIIPNEHGDAVRDLAVIGIKFTRSKKRMA